MYLIPKPKKKKITSEGEDPKDDKKDKKVQDIKNKIDNFVGDVDSKLKGEYKILQTKIQLWPLEKVFTIKKFFGLSYSRKFPMMSLRNYFGPKIALYFYFVGFFMNRLYIIGVVGFLVLFIRYGVSAMIDIATIYESTIFDAYNHWIFLGIDFLAWLFCLYLFIWGFRFSRDWKVHEKIFQINNGDTEENTGNANDNERINIRNYFYVRSMVTDELNTKSNNPKSMNFRIVLTIILTLFLGLMAVGMSIGVLILKNFLLTNKYLWEDPYFETEQLLSKLLYDLLYQ